MNRLLVVALLALGSAAFGQEPAYLPFRMVSTSAAPFPYYIDNRSAAPGGFSITAARPAIEAAWDQWNNVSCSMPKTVSRGFTSGTVPNPQDRFDAFSVTPTYITDRSDPDARALLDDGLTLAITVPQAYGGVLITCDIFLNGMIYAYSTSATTNANEVDVQTVMTHEAGHCLGLDHFGLGLMQGSINKGVNFRSLTQLDVRGICERNPEFGKAGAQCFADGGCESNLKCITRSGNVGPPRYCANPCVPNTIPCPVPMDCQPNAAFPNGTSACQYSSTTVTLVGKSCQTNPECGSAVGTCMQPTTSPTGTVLWEGGYCSQRCEAGQPACPSGAVCLPATNGQKLCIQSCRVGLADCRPGYTCDAISETSGNAGVCIPLCRVEADCFDPIGPDGGIIDQECRVCDGRCVPKQTPGVSIGTVCSENGQCGAGQLCRQADRRFSTKQCTLGCGRGCGACPTGSACVPDDRGELFCLRTCSGPASCGQGLRCADFPGVKACIPACRQDMDCPVGQTCLSGECTLPIDPEDSGCGAFCNVPDAGKPFVPKPDAGPPTGGGNAGCACSTPSAIGPMLLMLAVAIARLGRRRER